MEKKIWLDKLNNVHSHIFGGVVTPLVSVALYTIMKLMNFNMKFSVLRTKLVKFDMMDMDAMGALVIKNWCVAAWAPKVCISFDAVAPRLNDVPRQCVSCVTICSHISTLNAATFVRSYRHNNHNDVCKYVENVASQRITDYRIINGGMSARGWRHNDADNILFI